MSLLNQIIDIKNKLKESVDEATEILGSVDDIDSDKLKTYLFTLLKELPFCPFDFENHVDVILLTRGESMGIYFQPKTKAGKSFVDFILENSGNEEKASYAYFE